METKTQQQSVCFAYFGDGKFLGWYADSFGSIRPSSPKVYSSLDGMRETITKNFRYKISKVKSGEDVSLNIPNAAGAYLINGGLKEDAKQLGSFNEIVLKVVACPFYDGPNPDYNEAEYDALCAARGVIFNAEGIDLVPAGHERTNLVNEFNTRYPRPKANNWIYADYSKVKEWALNEPTEFLTVITSE